VITALVLAGHMLLDAWLGWALLACRRARPLTADHVPAALLLGMYVDTLCVGTLLFLGVSLAGASAVMLIATVLVTALAWRGLRLPVVTLRRPRWFEALLLLTIAEKIAFALWQMARLPLYFDDALTHWSGRARALFGGVNWSLDPESPVWLGPNAQARHYPLLTVVWRAETALVCGSWDDVLARADGLLFFLAVLAVVWLAVLRFSQSRGLAALATFIVAALPLQVWHAAAGYSDIGVEAFAVAAVAALLRQEWGLAGVLAAGTAWTKNDGLVVFLPPLLLGAVLMQAAGSAWWRRLLWFLAGAATLTPWLLVKISLSLGVAPNKDQLSWHADTFAQFFDKVLTGPTSSILWLGVLAALLYTGRTLLREPTGRGLLAILAGVAAVLFFVYGCTDSHKWLANDGTIHRSMLQLSATAVVVCCYGLWQTFQPASSDSQGPDLSFRDQTAKR
jgi:hypothetical protein